jgi:hypothetical protein
MEFEQRILEVQKKLNAPKKQFNNFGRYNYRSAEDILEAVKPLLIENNILMFISDVLINKGDRYYIKSIVTLRDGLNKDSETYVCSAYAREEESKKGMDGSQITGTASSYARKYALNATFLIDDVKDADHTNTHGNDKQATTSFKTANNAKLERPYSAEIVIRGLGKKGEFNTAPISEETVKKLTAKLTTIAGKQRKQFLLKVFGADSTNDLTQGQGEALMEWAKVYKNEAGEFVPTEDVRQEFTNVMEYGE